MHFSSLPYVFHMPTHLILLNLITWGMKVKQFSFCTLYVIINNLFFKFLIHLDKDRSVLTHGLC